MFSKINASQNTENYYEYIHISTPRVRF